MVPLAARRGAYEAPYAGDVYLLDFTVNNPGSAGGLLVDVKGQPLGMLGKELRSSAAGIWLNYAFGTGCIENNSDSRFPNVEWGLQGLDAGVEAIAEGDPIYTINAETCTDCGACVGVCPVSAIAEG